MPGTRGPVPVPLHDGQQDVTQQVLDALSITDAINTGTAFPDLPQAEIKAALDRLASRSMVTYDTNEKEQLLLTKEAETICAEGSHEFKVWEAVKKAGGLKLKELPVSQEQGA